jgi:hypothetical protein
MTINTRPRLPWWLLGLGVAMLALLVLLVRQVRLPEVPVVKKKSTSPDDRDHAKLEAGQRCH